MRKTRRRHVIISAIITIVCMFSISFLTAPALTTVEDPPRSSSSARRRNATFDILAHTIRRNKIDAALSNYRLSNYRFSPTKSDVAQNRLSRIRQPTVDVSESEPESTGQFEREIQNEPRVSPTQRECVLTVVSSLLDIGRGDWYYYRRPFDQYLSYLHNLLTLDVNLILFIDTKAIPLVERERGHLMHKTVIHPTKVDDLPLSAQRLRMQTIIANERQNWNPEWDATMKYHPESMHPDYDIFMNSKAYFLLNASIENPFHCEYLVWMDAGYGHGKGGIFPLNTLWTPTFPKDKVTVIKVTPDWDPITSYSITRLYRKDVSVISGGFVAMHKNMVARFYTVYQKTVMDLLGEDKIDDDQTVLVVLINRYSYLFNVAHGDWFDAFKLFP